MPGKILVIDHRTPTPDQDSGSASTFSYLQILSRAGYDITFAPSDLLAIEPYISDIEQLGIRTLAMPEWNSMTKIIETFGPQSDILLFYRVNVASALFDLSREKAPNARIIFHAVDLHFLRSQRQAEVTGKISESAKDIAALRSVELDLMRRADAAIVVSAWEHDLVRRLVPEAKVHHIPILREQPPPLSKSSERLNWHSSGSLIKRTVNWFKHRLTHARSRRRDILFVGGFEHSPNVDAVEWFVREIWPKILRGGFRDKFIIVGSKTPPQIQALASKRIIVRGYVKELNSEFERCRVSIAPLRYGGGVKGKIVTSLSQGLPVIASSIAAEGMGLRDGVNILVADTPAEFASQVLRAVSDDELWLKISENGRKAFDRAYSHSSGAPKILALVEGLLTEKMQPLSLISQELR